MSAAGGLIAVTGATGAVGGRVARLLAERGVAQRLVVRDPARAPRAAGAEVRAAPGYGDGDAMRAALEGAQTLFLVPAEESTERVEQHRTAVDAALAAGVGRIVYLSFLARGARLDVHARARPLGDRGAHPRGRRRFHVRADEPLPGLRAPRWPGPTG